MNNVKNSNTVTDSRQIIKNLIDKKSLCKTIFKLQPDTQKFIDSISIGDKKIKLHEFFDILSNCIKDEYERCKRNNINMQLRAKFDSSQDDRKSYTISTNARDVFNNISKLCKLPRDTIVENSVLLLKELINESLLTIDKKIEYAKFLKSKIDEIYDIYYDDDVQDVILKLIGSGDIDFNGNDIGTCSEEITYVSRIVDLDTALENFIEKKERERENEKN